MATSPTPSLDSIRGTNSIESYGEHNGYLSDSPLTLSGSSPPVSDSAICDEFTTNVSGNTANQHHPISASVSSASSASSTSSSSSSPLSSSGLSGCGSSNSSVSSGSSGGGGGGGGGGSGGGNGTNGTSTNSNVTSSSNGPGVIGSGKGSPCTTLISNGNILNVTTADSTSAPRCTACKSKQSDAVAKCFDCMSYLCANCVTAHQFMHCFNGHNVCLIKGFDSQSNAVNGSNSSSSNSNTISISNSTANTNTIANINGSSGAITNGNVNGNNTLNGATNSNNADYKLSSSLTMMLQQQHQLQQFQKQQPLSQLSKIVLNSHATSTAAAAAFGNGSANGGGGGDSHAIATHAHQTSQDANGSISTNGCGDELFGSLLGGGSSGGVGGGGGAIRSQPLYCHRHKLELLKFSCRSCCTLVCKECVVLEHSSGLHEVEHVQDTLHGCVVPVLGSHHTTPETVVKTVIDELRSKVDEIESNVSSSVAKIKMQYQKAHNEVNETYQFFCSMLDERKQELLKELETLYNTKITTNNTLMQCAKELTEKTTQTCNAIERSPKQHNIAEVLLLRKTFESQLHTALQEMQLPFELEFMSNYQSIQAGVRNTFGYIRANNSDNGLSALMVGGGNAVGVGGGKQPPIARPSQSASIVNGVAGNGTTNAITGCATTHLGGGLGLAASHLLDSAYANGTGGLLGRNGSNGGSHHHLGTGGVTSSITHTFDDLLSKQYQSGSGNGAPFVGVAVNPYEKWSNGGSDNLFASSDPFSNSQLLASLSANGNGSGGVTIGSAQNALSALSVAGTSSTSTDSLMDLKLLATSMYPPKSQIKRHKMIYHCKFGEFGVMEGQFTEPSGVAVNAQNDIIVADTNNHRIQIFDKEGRFKFQFGECGKRDSQLLYPNRVAVVRTSGDIIVTERSPTHQIQIYNQYGQFVRKFGANILQHPRGVTVDNKGRIIVVECKVMRVIIFDQNGNVLHKFGCSKHLEFPNGVVVNDKQEIFISDNRAHCVKVFNYEGQFLRQIGGEGVTNYPIGVGINANGDILIADNHNNFNLTIFTQDGQLISALESKVKHAQCFDVSLMDDGSVVLASKDYRLYIYRYVQVPPNGP